MAWPFPSVTAFNFDSGILAVPVGVTSVSSLNLILVAATFTNANATATTISLVNTANEPIATLIDVPPGVLTRVPLDIYPILGFKWTAAHTGVSGKVWGWSV